MPVREPASIAMLQRVMRASIESARTAGPAYSSAWPVPPPAPMAGDQVEGEILRAHAGREPPVDPDAHDRGRRCQTVWVASTCSTSEAPMPKARAPIAPCVAVCESPHTMREARQRQALLRPDHVDDALPRIAGPEKRESPLPRRSATARDLALDLGRGAPARRRRDVVVGHRHREVGAADAAARVAEHLEGVEGALVNEVSVDVEEVAAARVRRHDVPRPDLLEHRPPGHRGAIVRRSRRRRSPP